MSFAQCTIQWFSVFLQSCAIITALNFRTVFRYKESHLLEHWLKFSKCGGVVVLILRAWSVPYSICNKWGKWHRYIQITRTLFTFAWWPPIFQNISCISFQCWSFTLPPQINSCLREKVVLVIYSPNLRDKAEKLALGTWPRYLVSVARPSYMSHHYLARSWSQTLIPDTLIYIVYIFTHT